MSFYLTIFFPVKLVLLLEYYQKCNLTLNDAQNDTSDLIRKPVKGTD